MGNVSGNYYKLRKQYEHLKEKNGDLEEQISALKGDLDIEQTKDHNQIITKLTNKVRLLLRKQKKNDEYIQSLKDKCSHLIRSGFLHYDLYKLLFDVEIEMDDIAKLLIFGTDTPQKRLNRRLWETRKQL